MTLNRKNALKTAIARRGVSISMADWYAWGQGFDAALNFNFILYVLGFLCLFRNGEEW